MTIKQFIERKPKHVDSTSKVDRVKKRSRKEGPVDPWKWCPADEGLLKDNKIYINIDTDEMVIDSVTIEGEVIDRDLDISKMEEEIKRWKSK